MNGRKALREAGAGLSIPSTVIAADARTTHTTRHSSDFRACHAESRIVPTSCTNGARLKVKPCMALRETRNCRSQIALAIRGG